MFLKAKLKTIFAIHLPIYDISQAPKLFNELRFFMINVNKKIENNAQRTRHCDFRTLLKGAK
ncbi:hypothetical protein F901_02053 [Acinetobacter dispersus]|nr:hypothetical protein F901_02053 [Acinetobacter dispersus]